MDDKYLMENLMYGCKVINDLYMHGVIESANEKVYTIFLKGIDETLKMHYDIFKAMEEAGFYKTSNVDEKKIKQTKEKLEQDYKNCLSELN